jgi:hypothetical protein
MSDRCPVCNEDLGFEPWGADGASFEICPGCGIQFGYNDARPDLRAEVHAAWRDEWVANGRKPFEGEKWRTVSRRVVERALARIDAG